MSNIEKFNSKNHRYITYVLKEDGYLIIHGRVGMKKFLYYSLRDATTKYNQEVKKLLDK